MATPTKERILDAAEHLFADLGYAGASVRAITSKAGVDLGAVRYHYGSKEGLFSSVVERRVNPLCGERLAMLDAIETEYPNGSVPLEGIIEAFVRPGVQLVTNAAHGRDWIKLIGRMRVEPGPFVGAVQQPYEEMLARFLKAFELALPQLSKQELTYRFFFLFGVQINALIDDGTLLALNRKAQTIHQDPKGVMQRLIRFVTAGMTAPSESKDKEPGEVPDFRRMRLG